MKMNNFFFYFYAVNLLLQAFALISPKRAFFQQNVFFARFLHEQDKKYENVFISSFFPVFCFVIACALWHRQIKYL